MRLARKATEEAAEIALQAAHNESITNRLLVGENALDHWLILQSDLLSPIVVKETRQALRSRQFVWTFGFLLLCIIGWTLLSVVSLMPGIYFYPSGPQLLQGYLVLLAIPALIIIPLAAFFSMSGELNSNTFDVLSITPLSSHKIVLGKIVVAGVQLVLYFSALTPCIALTYLLRGVSLTSLVMIFPIMIVGSFLTICISVMMATFCRTVLHSILFLLVQLAVSLASTFTTLGFVFSVLGNGSLSATLSTPSGALSLLGVLLVLAGYGVLAILVGGAAIGIPGENYARPIRAWLSFQALLLFWFCILELPQDYDWQQVTINLTLTLLCLHWGLAGVFMVSEVGLLSVRAQRTLADSATGRLLGVWLNPGGGTGYFFVLLNFAGYVSTFSALIYLTAQDWISIQLVASIWCYVALYLGLLRLLMIYIPKGGAGVAALPFLFGCLLLSLGSGLPTFLSLYFNDFRQSTYEAYCFTNPFWTLSNFAEAVQMQTPVLLLYFSAIVIVCINAVMVSGDVTLVRVKSPMELDLDLKQRRSKATTEDPFATE